MAQTTRMIGKEVVNEHALMTTIDNKTTIGHRAENIETLVGNVTETQAAIVTTAGTIDVQVMTGIDLPTTTTIETTAKTDIQRTETTAKTDTQTIATTATTETEIHPMTKIAPMARTVRDPELETKRMKMDKQLKSQSIATKTSAIDAKATCMQIAFVLAQVCHTRI